MDLFFDESSVAAIVAALDEFIFDTNEGREYAAKKFKFDWVEGQNDMVYTATLPDGSEAQVKGDDVVFLKSCLIKGEFFPPHQVVEKVVDNEECEMCKQSLHCTRLVKDPNYEDKIRVCNHCLIYLPSAVGDEASGGLEECLRCPKTECNSHPDLLKKGDSRHPIHF